MARTRKNCLLEYGFVTSNQFEAQSYVESLPEIGSVGPQQREKMVRFESDKTLDADNEKACVLRLPDIKEPYGCEGLEEKRIEKNGEFYSKNSELNKGLEGISRNGVGYREELALCCWKTTNTNERWGTQRALKNSREQNILIFGDFFPKALEQERKTQEGDGREKTKKRDEPIHPREVLGRRKSI